jgi:CubicO group peptidase (beta-lactamase class C family)
LTAEERTGAIGFTRRDLGRFLGLAGAGLPALTRLPVRARLPAPARLPALTGLPVLAGPPVARPAEADTRVWHVTGHALPGLADLDATVMAFMEDRSIACGSLAVTRNGRLLLARGYTWAPAPRTPAPRTPTGRTSSGSTPAVTTRPVSLFRTASVSKPVTAAAVLRLVQDGRLRLHDRVSDLLRLGGVADPRLGRVTVLHLLRHRGGWDRKLSGDPMFDDPGIASALGRRLPIGREDIVRYVTGRRLDHDPGTTFAYSNYGYLLLGRIIERVTGMPYAAYVNRAVLAPLGIGRMRLGRTLAPAPGEVPYHSQFTGPTVMDPSGAPVPAPYGSFNLENNAFNCGWLASAVDLARFARIYDGVTPVLSRASAAVAFARPPMETTERAEAEETAEFSGEAGGDGHFYGCGWHVRPAGSGLLTWHSGSLPGTHTLLVRRPDGLTWAVMFDQRDDPSGERYRDIDGALHEAADDIETWPAGDLGGLYFAKGAGQ